MKNKYLILLLVLAALIPSCGDFLEEVSKDQIVPKTVTDYSELLYGEVYYKRNHETMGYIHTWLDIMTDDCEDWAKVASYGNDTRVDGFGYYAWQAEPEIRPSGVRNNDTSWAHYYHQILMSNIILYALDDMTGAHDEKMWLKAECHMVRAYAYYMLVNMYGEPYDPLTADSALGVPINDLVGPADVNFRRESVARIYRQITDDISAAMTAFDQAGNVRSTIFRWNRPAAAVFASRVALYMRDWDKAIGYATEAISAKPKLWNLEEKNALDKGSVFFNKNNPEILFSFGYYNITFFASLAPGAFPTSSELKAMYSTGDLRYGNSDGHFIRNQGSLLFGGGKRYVQFKNDIHTETGVFGWAIRNAEAYLNRAEAYANKGTDLALAVGDLNTLRKERFREADYAELTVGTQAEVIRAVRDERRRELCFEQHRWFDLRRWDRPEIIHTYTPVPGETSSMLTFILRQDDPAYTLPIPMKIMESDYLLKNIHRPRRDPEQGVL